MRTLITGLLVIMLCAGVARAQVKSDDFKRDLARAQFKIGAKYYEVGEYRKALDAFGEAHRLSQKPGLLFNIGRCHELLGEPGEAVKFYRRYLKEKPAAPNAGVLKVKVENLQRALDAKKPPESVKPEPVKPEPVKPEPVKPPGKVVVDEPGSEPAPADGSPGWIKTTGWIALGVGAGTLVAASVLGGMVLSDEEHFAETEQRTWIELQALEQSGREKADASTALFVAGGVLAAAGGGLLIYHYLIRKDRPAAVTLVPLGGEVFGVAAVGRF